MDEVDCEDLELDEGEDERDRLVHVTEAADEDLDDCEQRTERPRRANAFALQITAASRVTAKAAGIESTANAMSAATIATTTSSNSVPNRCPSSRTSNLRRRKSVVIGSVRWTRRRAGFLERGEARDRARRRRPRRK
jgi:hypothetical protein